MMHRAGKAQYRWSRLNSNVRPRNRSRAVLQQNQRPSAWTERPRRGGPEETVRRTIPRSMVDPCRQIGGRKDGRLVVATTLPQVTKAMTGNRRATSENGAAWEASSVRWVASGTGASADSQGSGRLECAPRHRRHRGAARRRAGTGNYGPRRSRLWYPGEA